MVILTIMSKAETLKERNRSSMAHSKTRLVKLRSPKLSVEQSLGFHDHVSYYTRLDRAGSVESFLNYEVSEMFFDDIDKCCRARRIVFRLIGACGGLGSGKLEARLFVFLAQRISICFVNKFGLAQREDVRPVDIRWQETESIESVPVNLAEIGCKLLRVKRFMFSEHIDSGDFRSTQ